MAAYLVVDLDDLLLRFRSRGIAVDVQELAVGLRGGAALAAGLASAEKLKAVAVGNWQMHRDQGSIDLQYIFKAAGYDVFDMPSRESLADALIIHYFSYDPEPIDELILATTSRDLLPVIRRVKTTRNARIRMWGSEDVLKGTEFEDSVVFQPLETLLGIQSKNVAVYIDFENIAISLNEQGFMVNLDHLLDRFIKQAKAHGHVVKMAAYAPWGQRGTLPPLVDSNGREIADEAPSRLALANIDPVFNLPGKNSADIRIARDVLTDSGHSDAADVYIMASGDRDFNDVLNTLVKRNRVVIVWGVRGSTSRQLENNPGINVEFIDDFTNLQTHQ
ncbi:MAG: NYN domain-containing protein, partial [Chitinophagaceae bacterium]|nr:NYN domain-containing protein [Anaerolineae bacterium]